jgi:Predicted membrane protein (DUF2238)
VRGNADGPHDAPMRTMPARPGQRPRLHLSPAELVAVGIVGSGAIGFGAYGVATAAPSTVSYLGTVAAIAAGLAWCTRRRAIPPTLILSLAILALAHLAGGLVRVGDEVLYNTHAWTPVLQYDHLVHATGVFLGTLTIWWLFLDDERLPRRADVLIALVAGLELGAINETIEFATTMVHDSTHVGGYQNTGWDLVSNLVGASAAAAIVRRHAHA